MDEFADRMTGIEISQGETILFRGGVLELGDSYWLYNEDGTLVNPGFSAVTSDGLEIDGDGTVTDKMEPSISIIYDLLNNPELTHKGDIWGWVTAMFLCSINTLSILYADQLFRWRLAFWIRDVENAEPSEVEVASRHIGWMLTTIGALICFVLGLQ